jgi:hypothetical protein
MKKPQDILSKDEILRIRGAYTAKYAIVPDDSLTCLLCEIAEISTKIDKSVRPFQFNNFWTSFAFGLGKYGMALLIFFSIIFLFMYRNYFGSLEQKEKFERVNQTLNKYQNITDFEDFIKDSKRVLNPVGLPIGTYLEFKVSKTIKDGFSSSTQGVLKSDSVVYVPLYFSPRSERN